MKTPVPMENGVVWRLATSSEPGSHSCGLLPPALLLAQSQLLTSGKGPPGDPAIN